MFRSSRARRLVAIAALLAIVVSTVALAVTAAVDAAPAHGDEGTMTITKAEATSPTSIRVEAGLVYANDEELATGATVTATATGPGGATAGPAPLSRLDEDSSVYGGDLTVPQPGSWQVQVTSTEPAAEASSTVEVAQATTTTAPSATSTTAAAPSTTAAELAPETSNAAATKDDDDGDSNTGLIALVVAAVVVVGGGVSWYLVSKRGSPEDTDSDDGLPPAAP
jgi:hypothetical protein